MQTSSSSITHSPRQQRALAELERRHPALWRAGQLGQAAGLAVCPTGHPLMDAELPGGGWPCGAVTELLVGQHGSGELRLLVPALQGLAQSGRRIGLVGSPYLPNAVGLAALGLPPGQCYWVRPAAEASQAVRQADMLWAAEQMLRSRAFGAVLVWLPAARPEALRRLQVLAQAGDAPVWVLRPATAVRESSPAVLRLVLAPQPGNVLSIVFHKRRGPVRDAPLLLPLGGMEGVVSRPAARVPAPSASSTASSTGSSTASSPSSVSPPVSSSPSSSNHVVLDRGASAAPAAGRAATELA